jgi:hypothetical protein
MALGGVVIGVIGLFMKSLVTDGEAALPDLNAASPESFPDGIPTIWGGLDGWAQIVLVILIIAVVFLAVRPVIGDALSRTDSMIVGVIGIALLAYAVIKWMDAGDKADALAGGFTQAAEAGLLPAALEVTRGVGFFVLIVGTVLVAAAGALGLMGRNE